MSATGYTPILIYASGTATNVPLAANLTSSASGAELALNYADGKLFYKDSGGVVQILASKAGNVNVSSFSAGTTGLTPNTATTGAVTLAGTLATTNGGTGLTSFTANGVVYASSTSALTTGSALTFDGSKLAIGTTAVDVLTVLGAGRFGNGTNAIGLGGDSSCAYLEAAAGTAAIKFNTGGSEQMRLTSTGLGIGTSSPANKLDVGNGSTQIAARLNSAGGSGAGPYLRFDKASVQKNLIGSYSAVISGTSDDLAYWSTTGAGHQWIVNNNGSASMVLDSSGNLGLASSASAWGNGYHAYQVGPYASFAGTNAGYTAVTNNAYQNSSGQWVSSTTNFPISYLQYTGDGSHRWYSQPAAVTGGATYTPTNVMTLDASGNLLVGGTSASFSTPIFITPNNGSGYISANHATGTPSGNFFAAFNYNAATIGSITQSGTTAVLYNLTSDQRLKTNIADAAPASALIDAIQVRQYDWKSDGSHQRYGFIAQELVTVAPEAVHQPADPEEMMAVDYSKLVPMLVKEIQSLRQRLAAAGI